MRISDWSSDVCSSDLLPQLLLSASALAVHRPAAGEKPVSAVAARARPGDPAFAADVLTGLSQPQKTVPARWFYDHRGSELFEEITRLPEYYPTRTEIGLLKRHAAEVAELAGRRAVVEFGSGRASGRERVGHSG